METINVLIEWKIIRLDFDEGKVEKKVNVIEEVTEEENMLLIYKRSLSFNFF